MNKYQTLAANTILMSVGTFGSKLLVFLMVRFYTGYLTPAEYGTADLITQDGGVLRGAPGHHPGLRRTAAGHRPSAGRPGRPGVWVSARILRHRLLLSWASMSAFWTPSTASSGERARSGKQGSFTS